MHVDFKLEVVVLPVSDVDRAKNFYKALGWREDADFVLAEGVRVVQLTPPGSATSIHVGSGITDAAPGSVRNTYLTVRDVEAARAELLDHGVQVSEAYHFDANHVRVPGPAPQRGTYSSFAEFRDPDGNSWLLQEITSRLPGRVTGATYGSAEQLADALRRAAAAHGRHEVALGHGDPEWPVWYADYMTREQSG
jgi:catechol 2,3-dioxygenase-like lactoylglutathione lyase family enzyme